MSDARPLATASERLRERPPPGFPGRPGRPRKHPIEPGVEGVVDGSGRPPGSPLAGTPRAQRGARTPMNGRSGGGAGVRQAPAPAALAALSPRLLDLRAAALYLGLAAWTVRGLEWKGVLQRVRVPLPGGGELRKLLFDRVDLDRLIGHWKEDAAAPEAVRRPS